jgi:hypothetical protein
MGKKEIRILWLEQEEDVVEGSDKLHEYITNYYKLLFWKPERNNYSMVESLNDDIPQIIYPWWEWCTSGEVLEEGGVWRHFSNEAQQSP